MAELLQNIGPEWIIAITGVFVAVGIYFVLRRVGRYEPGEKQLLVEPEVSKHGERRAMPRKRTGPLLVDLVDPEGIRPRHSGLVHDVSTGGLALKCQNDIPVGSTWTVVLRSGSPVKVGLPVEVRACNRFESGFLVSCQFLRTVSYNELLNFS